MTPTPSWDGLPLHLELIGAKHWRLMRAIEWRTHKVPEGWLTDLTSIPWWVPWIRREGKHTPASVLHDRLYAKPPPGWTRRKCDRAYHTAMVTLDVVRRDRGPIWAGVRAFGWVAWRRYRKTDRAYRRSEG